MEKIFVSSTCYDLIDLRAELEQELRDIGLNPIMSDRLTSDFEIYPDKNSIETCLINLRQADAVIVILSQRYGPSLKKAGFEDISATHLEYREAVKNNIPIYFYVRDMLEAEFNIYSSGKDKNILKWIKSDDIQIFAFFKEHKELRNGNKNNWYYSFRDVIDLKNRLSKDLKKHSSNAILKRIQDSGQAPCIIIGNITGKILPDSNILSFIVHSKNVGNSVAIQPCLNFYQWSDYEKGLRTGEEPLIEDTRLHILETLLPTETQSSEFTLKITDEEIANGEIELLFEISYTTITGYYLADLNYLSFYFDSQKMEVNEISTTYETKKYYHSNAIKHEISVENE